ncbi:lysozyme inhibitor LprI family protein [Burkholderia gladioli]|uniref:lysozyme inhibitor LprI family protein n=1 Tax=Burkholderia gladioli TaxID=28095 RepID=UPI000F80BF2B|nr:lysozyme inhibitor LprI family protein [Burkholderia gladioli]MBA1365043.1 DUF1311 domain-containing protein [Burkholderia gladioli]MDN7809678.1 lysozyme inhibitor LprI family protein [Burkholderia gladioli]
MNILKTSACALLLASSSVFAAQPGCMDKATTQAAMNACAAGAYKQSDAALNSTYRALVAKLGEPGKTRLKEAQRRWLAWRDAQCAFEASSVDGGSAAPMLTSQCLDQLTQAQTKLLDSHLHCQEGDISCSN